MKKNKLLSFLFSLLISQIVFGQSEIDTGKIYTSLEQALEHPKEVYKLQLRKLSHHELPDTIFSFENLVWLDVSRNKLKEIPAGIGKLSHLKYLDASKNKLTSIPYTLGFIKNLEVLLLSQNEIFTLPKEIGNLENLRFLDLWSNEIDQFPESIRDLKKLKKLDMRVININEPAQLKIKDQLPNTEIFFSGGCNCGK